MTKERLEQYQALKGEAEDLRRELAAMPQITDTVRGSSSLYPYCVHPIAIHGLDPVRSDKLAKLLAAKVSEADRERIAIEKWLDTVTDAQIRRIVRLKYIEGKTWQQVALAIGHYDFQYPYRKLDRYLCRCTKCTKNPC